ncbi:MAG: hypothetical protein Cpurp_00270 [Chlorogloea purpurea SAG 13.99]|nr:hypothetical protein [Chlorogloea purpurea SAG 13.99]
MSSFFSNINDSVLAAQSPPEKLEEAADKIVENKEKEGAKKIFGQTYKGDELIDKARDVAQDKLQNLAQEARKDERGEANLSPSEKSFIKKF